ncbi:TPA: hypothetical protein HA265_01320 [Candidatus Woesearchaeota archaeon]|nr:hypothetical protein [Candidatus Woesearchaeota archaeon]
MQRTKAPLERIIPIQTTVYRKTVEYFRPREIAVHLPVVIYGAGFLLIDMTNRAYVLYERGAREFDVAVIESDEEFRENFRAPARHKTLEGFIRHYEEVWKPTCQRLGVYRISDLRIG